MPAGSASASQSVVFSGASLNRDEVAEFLEPYALAVADRRPSIHKNVKPKVKTTKVKVSRGKRGSRGSKQRTSGSSSKKTSRREQAKDSRKSSKEGDKDGGKRKRRPSTDEL